MTASGPPTAVAARSVAVLLAAAAGAIDLVALFHLGGAFASVVTGNLVIVGASIATGDLARLAAAAVAVGSYAVGVTLCSLLWRRTPGALVGELVLLCGALVLLVLHVPALLTLLLLAAAMGTQSVVGLELRTSTTYMTGALTTALHGLVVPGGVDGRRGARAAAAQLGALVIGAAVAAVASRIAPWAALALPVGLVVAAIAVTVRGKRAAAPAVDRSSQQPAEESSMSRPVLVPSPEHPITVEPSSAHVTVRVGDTVIADTTAAVVLQEASYPAVYYIPRADVTPGALSDSDTTSYCAYKGDASYFSVSTDGDVIADAVWTYERPYAAVDPIAGRVAFYPDKVDITVA